MGKKKTKNMTEEPKDKAVKNVSGNTSQTDSQEKSEEKQDKNEKYARQPKSRSKKYKEAKKKIDRDKLYSLKKAIELVKDTSYSSFDGTIELHLVTKKDVNQLIELPNATGKERVVEIADDKTVKKLEKGEIDFDVLLATPEMMPKIVPFARLLGPRGLMPNPKAGTLIKDKKEAKKFMGNKLRIKTERKQKVVHTIIGKVSHTTKKLQENAEKILNEIGTKSIIKCYLTASMSPSVKVKID